MIPNDDELRKASTERLFADLEADLAELRKALRDSIPAWLVALATWQPKTYAERIQAIDTHMARAHYLARRDRLIVTYGFSLAEFGKRMAEIDRAIRKAVANASRRLQAEAIRQDESVRPIC